MLPEEKPEPGRYEPQVHTNEAEVNENGPLSVGQLIRSDDREFVTKVYCGVLGREPDRMALAPELLELRSGLSDKIEILGNI